MDINEGGGPGKVAENSVAFFDLAKRWDFPPADFH